MHVLPTLYNVEEGWMEDTWNVKVQEIIDQGQERMLSQKDWCLRHVLCIAPASVLVLLGLALKFYDFFVLEYFLSAIQIICFS